MNKRIENLFEQALDAAVPETWTRLDMDQVKRLCDKFAELTIRECAKLADDTPGEYLLQPYHYPSTYIKEQLGVKE